MKDIQLWQGDCLELMNDIPDHSIDMILCDLPYGITQNKCDVCVPLDNLWRQYIRIIKDNTAILLFGQGTFYVDLVNSNRNMFRYDLIWDKQLSSGHLNAHRMPLRKHEQIAVFYKKLPTYNPQFTKGKPLHSKGHAYKEKPMINNNYGKFNIIDDDRCGETNKYPTSILSCQKPHPSTSIHPTQKPVELCEWLIKTYTDEGDIVLDNCMGSGTTGVACRNLNRKFIGIELNGEYFDIAQKRIYG